MNDSIKNKIIEKSTLLGFQKVGFADADFYESDKKNLYSWIDNKYNADMEWINKRKEERANVLKYFPEAKTVISFAYNYFTGRGSKEISNEYKFSNYAWGDDYHIVIKKYLFEIAEYIQSFDEDLKYRVCVDTSPLMERNWAVRSGIGWIGKNTNLITKDFGSWLFLGEIIIDKKIKPTGFFEKDYCGTCTACLDSCPTDALKEPYLLDSNKCISYLTIEHRGEIPEKQKDSLQNWIYGCDICQEVCPWNIRFETMSNDLHFYPREDIKNKKKIKDWDQVDQETYNDIFRKSAAKRTKYEGLKRNIKLVK